MEKNKAPFRQNPKTNSSFLSNLFFCWLTPFIRLGTKSKLQVDDLYKVLPTDESVKLGFNLNTEWLKELNKVKPDIKPNLTSAIRRTFGHEIGCTSLLLLFEQCGTRILQPLLMSQLIRYFDPVSEMKETEAYLYATGVVLCSASFSITERFYTFQMKHIGMQIRVASCSLIFKKCLVLSQKALGEDTSLGQIINLMSNDVNRFDAVSTLFNYLWISPLQALITITILYFYIGYSCFVGLGLIFIFVPMQGWTVQCFSKLRLKTAERTDVRIRTMSEILTGIRVIKMCAWEKPFAALINLQRKMEVKFIRMTGFFRALRNSVSDTSIKLFVFLTFVVYKLTGNHLAPGDVFLSVALFNNLYNGLAHDFLNAISLTAETRVSLQRIQKFLLLDEITDKNDGNNLTNTKMGYCEVNFNKVTAKWSSSMQGNALTKLTLNFQLGKAMAIIGHVGSGKSSLLNVILGELPLLEGNCKVNGKVAYASQEAWIFSGTINENILCGQEYNEQRYRQVVEAAALERDFTLLPKGDQTLVGERGISLSGGQKARVNLARCLYVDADIYLLDDPLSAVDTHVGRHLFDKAINGFLKDKTRILVTHQLQYLKEVDQILVLKDGRMEALGTLEELASSGHIDDLLCKANVDEDEPASTNQSALNGLPLVIDAESGDDPSIIIEEFRSSGSVNLLTYWKYFRAGGGIVSLTFLLLNFSITQTLFTGTDKWLSIWTDAEFLRSKNVTGGVKEGMIDTYTGIYVYAILVGGIFVMSMIQSIHFFVTCMFASVKLHEDMFQSVLRSPFSFFDKNPIGRTLNRFIKDIGCMDDELPDNFHEFLLLSFNVLGITVLVATMNWWFLLPVALLVGCFYFIWQSYLVTSLNVRRLEGTTRSPIFTHLSSVLTGLTTMRAHQYEQFFKQAYDERQDVHSSAYYLTLACANWFAILLDWTVVIYVACIAYGCTALHTKLNGSEAGLVLTSIMYMAANFNNAVQRFADVENFMTSTERVIEYGNLPSEAALESSEDRKPALQWPSEGDVRFERMSLSYDNDYHVLRNITCHVRPKAKIGIVGRTGAGKSSLIAALFRLTEPDGKIIIDGIDTKSIGLHDLRSKISIIPQDPVLFTGTLRKNLDPFGEYDDDVLRSVLEDVKLKESMAADVKLGLDFLVAEGGSNFSVGQRQLICLARTIFRKNRILVLDEATANVDQETDRLIQMTIRDKFKDSTVLTIAHRLDTIMDSDKIMVLDAGYLMEFDSPSNLIENKQSMFYKLVEKTGCHLLEDTITKL